MKKKISLLLPLIILASSCSNNQINDNYEQINQVNSLSKKISKNININFLDTKSIPSEIIDITQKDSQKASDKASKARGIDYFDIHKNPVALEFNFNNEKAYLLNYLGTSKNTEDLNIEFRSFYTNSEIGYNFNYSGPITISKTKDIEKGANKLSKNSSIKFELITGMPPEYIVNSLDEYLERQLKPSLKMIYKVDTNISDDIFPYAINVNNETKGFLFLISKSILRLGDRKYADVQLATFISNENEVSGKLVLIGFNPKTKISTQPKYDIKKIDDLNIVEFGDW